MFAAASLITAVRSSTELLSASDAPGLMMVFALILLFVAGSAISVLFRTLLAVAGAMLAPLFALVWILGFAVLLLLGAVALGFLDQPPVRG